MVDLKPYMYEIARLCRETIDPIDRVFEVYTPETEQGYVKLVPDASALSSVYVAVGAGARIGNFLDATAARDTKLAKERSQAIRQEIGDPHLPVIADRKARHSVEHYDERLDVVRSKLNTLELQEQYWAAESIVLSEMHHVEAPEFPYRVYRFPLMPARLVFPGSNSVEKLWAGSPTRR